MDDDWPDDIEWPLPEHEPGECAVCDWNRGRIAALDNDEPDPGPFKD